MSTGHCRLAALLLPFALVVAACGGGAGQGSGATGGAAGGRAGSNGSGGAAGGSEAGRGGTAVPGFAGAAGTAGGGPGGATTAAGGAGGATSTVCALATNGAACAPEGASCGGPCTDSCQVCDLITCWGGRWQGVESLTGPCFSCGNGKCKTQAQYCQTTIGGVPGSVPSYACVDIPVECAANRTCLCLAQHDVVGSCSMGANGELMTLLAAP